MSPEYKESSLGSLRPLYSSVSNMLPHRHNAMTTWTLQRGREPVLVLHRVLVSGPSQPLRLRPLDARYIYLGGASQALVVDARRIHKEVMGPYPPYVGSTWNDKQPFRSVQWIGLPFLSF